MEVIITHEELHTTIRKELAPTRLDIHEIKMDISNIDQRLHRIEVLVEGIYIKLNATSSAS